jgi:hypothetical protein
VRVASSVGEVDGNTYLSHVTWFEYVAVCRFMYGHSRLQLVIR